MEIRKLDHIPNLSGDRGVEVVCKQSSHFWPRAQPSNELAWCVMKRILTTWPCCILSMSVRDSSLQLLRFVCCKKSRSTGFSTVDTPLKLCHRMRDSSLFADCLHCLALRHVSRPGNLVGGSMGLRPLASGNLRPYQEVR